LTLLAPACHVIPKNKEIVRVLAATFWRDVVGVFKGHLASAHRRVKLQPFDELLVTVITQGAAIIFLR
jgi:hypothetical protein